MKRIIAFSLLVGMLSVQGCGKKKACNCKTTETQMVNGSEQTRLVQSVRREVSDKKDCNTLNSTATTAGVTTKVDCANPQ